MTSFLNNGDEGAVIHPLGRLSLREFAVLVGLLSDRLAALDPRPGTRIVTYLPNSLELLASYYACLLRGLVLVPISDRLTAREARAIIRHSEGSCLLTTPSGARRLAERDEPGLPVMTLQRIDEWLDRAAVRAPIANHPSWPDDHPAALFYTSGSTGAPKGVLYSHGTLTANSRLFDACFGITAADHSVLCHCMSTSFVFAQLTVPFLSAGATVEIVEFGNVEQTLGAIHQGATFLSLIPWFGYRVIEAARSRRVVPNRLRKCVVGGDRVPLDYFTRFEAVFGIVPAEQLGMAETNTTLVNPLVDGDLRLGSVGLPLPGVEVQIRDPSGRLRPAGEEGQIWVKTPGAMVGYWRDPDLTLATVHDGWIATGDLGWCDTDGYVWYTGRIKQIIIVDGDNIHPQSVERAIAEHPWVRQVCVVGLPHPTRGETVAAAVILRDRRHTLSRSELARFLEHRVTEVMIPSDVLVLERFPETQGGKLDRPTLAAAIASARDVHPPDRASS